IERGIAIEGATYNDEELYNLEGNRTHISGDVLEGWEVELLQNGTRIDYQIIGSEGRYDFRDLTLFSGANTFELIFYGPAGEQRTETIVRYSGASSIRLGNLSYRFTASQRDRKVHETKSDVITVINPADRGQGRYGATLSYGLFSNLSINGGVNSIVENDERLNYIHLGTRINWKYMGLALDATRDPLGGTILDADLTIPASFKLLGFNTKLTHTRYANSILATDDTTQATITSQTTLILTRKNKNTASRISANHNKLLDRSLTTYIVDLSKKELWGRVGNTLNYKTDSTQNSIDQFTGNLYFVSNFKPLNFRGNINYQIKPKKEALLYRLDSNLKIAIDMSMSFNAEHTPKTNITRYTAGLNWQLKHLTLTPRLSFDSEDRYSGFIFITTSIAPRPDRFGLLVDRRPMANNGTVVSRVFLDNDNDGEFGDNDTPLENVEVYAPQLFRQAKTDKNGTAYLTGLQAGKATDIYLNESTLPGITMRSVHEGNSVQPRSGSRTLIDFPIVPSGEIDGTLYQQRNKQLLPRPGVMVELRNAKNEVVDFKISANDGFFIFDQIPFGQYTVTLAEANRGKLTQKPPRFILNKNNPAKLGLELIMSAPKTASIRSLSSRAKTKVEPVVTQTIVPKVIETKPIEKPIPIIPVTNTTQSENTITPFALQLGAFRSKASAETAVAQLRKRFVTQLKGLDLKIKRANLGARGVFFRIHAIGNITEAEAKVRCNQIKQLKQSCIVVKQEFIG
ncbi:SPOR domain-containing protein, partial [Pseudomonadota bacterium]